MERLELPRRSRGERLALAATALVASLSVLGAVLLLFASVPGDAGLQVAGAGAAASAVAARRGRRG